MRIVLILFIIVSFITGCTSLRIDKAVNKRYTDKLNQVPPKAKNTNFVTVSSNLTTDNSVLSLTNKEVHKLLPLIFYWQWEDRFTTVMNPRIPINIFTTTVLPYSNRGLKQKIRDGRIELNIDQLPTSFIFKDKAHLIWFIHGFHWDFLDWAATSDKMIVSYKVFNKDNAETKSGHVEIQDTDIKVKGTFHIIGNSTVKDFLDVYDSKIEAMTKRVIDKVVSEL